MHEQQSPLWRAKRLWSLIFEKMTQIDPNIFISGPLKLWLGPVHVVSLFADFCFLEGRVEDECDVIPVTSLPQKTGKCSRECENSEKMMSRCAVGGCSNTPSLEEHFQCSSQRAALWCSSVPHHLIRIAIEGPELEKFRNRISVVRSSWFSCCSALLPLKVCIVYERSGVIECQYSWDNVMTIN